MWVARPAELGVFMDTAANAQAAYLLGRSGNPFKRLADRVGAWYSGRSLSPQAFYDERVAYRYLNDLAVQINKVTDSAGKPLRGSVKKLSVSRGKDGWVVNVTGGKVDPVFLYQDRLSVGLTDFNLTNSTEFLRTLH